ncbi:MAG: tetratricopeptide repeat protein, partial [Planctomycetes bacterium]|nr:tetratricopeptide repeat protein [Planctomycetota bacterium]
VRRHRVAVAAGAAVVLVTVGALIVVTQALLRTTAAEARERDGRTIAEAQARRAAAASDFLLDVFSAVDPGKDGRDVKMADALARAARDSDARLASQPGLQSALGQTIGLAYFGLGMLDEAETHLRHSLAAAETGHGQHSPEVARVLVDLALVLQRRGRLKEADAALQRGEGIAATLPPTDFTTTAIATRRADLLRASGDREAARRLLEPLVAQMRATRGPHDRSTPVATTLLAGVLHELGQLEPAERLYREAFEGFVAVKGEDHPDSLTALNNLMMVQYSRGQRRELLPTLQRLLDVRRRALGDDHPDTIATLNNLAGVSYGIGEFDRAAPLYREAADRIREREGRAHPVYARILANLATAERELGQYDAAIRHAEEAFELRREAAGPSHEGTLMTQALLADCHRFAGHLDVALPMFEQVRELAAQATPPQLANLYRCDLGLGRGLLALQRFDAAEQALLRCRDRFAAADQAMAVKGQLVPPDANLHELYTRWGKPELAQRYAPPTTK